VTFPTVKAQARTQVNPVLACAFSLFIGLAAPCLASHSLGKPDANEFSDPIFRSHELSLALAAADEPSGGAASEEK
jgi:hypothetical protein